MKGKMALIGEGDCTLIFKAGGMETFNVTDSMQGKKILASIKDQYNIIFITDNLAKELEEYIDEINKEVYPIILVIPNKDNNTGYGMEIIKREMERSLGIDILFNKD